MPCLIFDSEGGIAKDARHPGISSESFLLYAMTMIKQFAYLSVGGCGPGIIVSLLLLFVIEKINTQNAGVLDNENRNCFFFCLITLDSLLLGRLRNSLL